jgi:flagellar hook-associated protein 3 FlgL
MDRVSTAFAFKAGTADFLRAQGKQVEAQQQMSDGKRATDLRGFGRSSETLIAAKTVQARASSFVGMHKLLAGKLEAQNLALERTAEAAEASRQLLLGAVASNRGESLMKTLDSIFGQAADALNWKHEGRYLFAGSQVAQEPVAVKQMEDLTTPATVFTNDQTRLESRLNESSTLTTGFLADEIGSELFGVLRTIQAYHEDPATGPLTGELSADQAAFLKTQMPLLVNAHDGLLDRVAENGLMQQRVDDARDAQNARVNMLEGYIAEIAEVDFAEAFSRLQQAQLAVGASAQALKALKETSLLYLLR